MDSNTPAKSDQHMRGITHHVPHRTRYRLAARHRAAATVSRIKDSVLKVPGVKNVEFNERTGSLLVHHEEHPEIVSLLGAALAEIAGDLCVELAGVEVAALPGVSLIAQLVGKRFANMDTYMARRTNNYLDLKTLLPVVFLAAGIYQTAKNRAWFSQVPAWVLFYYAYDSYLKFHGQEIGLIAVTGDGNGHNNN